MRRVLGPIAHVTTESRVAALTFDDGPHPEFTPRLLGILQKHRVRATFFMAGLAAVRHPELVRRVATEGHVIGNHAWDHPSFPLLSRRERRRQILACARALAPYGQRLFRPPYGHLDVASRLDTLRFRYEVIGWSVTGEDWLDRDAEWMADRLVDAVRPGSIILLHDALYHVLESRYADRGPVLDAVDQLLGRLGRGFRFVTIPELLRQGRPQRVWYGKVDVAFLNSLHPTVGSPRRYAARLVDRVGRIPNV
jgi:peptidoglycan/xylan/chitin deacetylase (PgdA/CDA1 family)